MVGIRAVSDGKNGSNFDIQGGDARIYTDRGCK